MGEFQKQIETLAELIEKSHSISEEDTIVFSKLRKMVNEAKKELDLPHIKEKMKNYPEREWWTELERLVPILEHWFGKANAEGE